MHPGGPRALDEDLLDLCPSTKTWKTRGRPPEPHLAALRDRALLLTGFVGALRRSELSALDVTDVAEHPRGLVLTLPRSKDNAATQLGLQIWREVCATLGV